jgi:hypothetical protein
MTKQKIVYEPLSPKAKALLDRLLNRLAGAR